MVPDTHGQRVACIPTTKGKGRQIDNIDLLGAVDQVAWPTCSDHLSCHNNDAAKNGAMTTATTVMTTRRKAHGLDNFVTIEQTSVHR